MPSDTPEGIICLILDGVMSNSEYDSISFFLRFAPKVIRFCVKWYLFVGIFDQ